MSAKNFHVKNLSLASDGARRIEWAGRDMPVLGIIKKRFEKEKPLSGLNVSACLHVTTETANLVRALRAGGAKVTLCASNPLSTQDDVAACLAREGVGVYAIKGEDNKTYYSHIMAAIGSKPHITMDDGADVISTLHQNWEAGGENVLGGTEETTTGVIRLRAMERDGALRYPVIAVNDAQTKHLFDNRYGTGQSTVDGILRCTNRLLAGSTVVVAGYGWCGRGFAMRARGMGAKVTVTEVDAVKALEAAMDGFPVMPMAEACKTGDLFVTLTGDINVLDVKHFAKMKDGAMLANSGHFNVEINLAGLKTMSSKVTVLRPFVEEYLLKTGKRIIVLGEGRLINLAAAEGHPASVMDMSFANQALAAELIAKKGRTLKNKVYPVPAEIDVKISELKLGAMGLKVDKLTAEQKKYLASWREGT